MKILIIKTSSMGDVLHMLPAVTDMARAIPGIQIDWVVEEAFAEIPGWHPAVNRVIPVSMRRWRGDPGEALRSGEVKQFLGQLRGEQYDRVIDAQGLVKSAMLARLAQGERCGMDWDSCREPLASLAYQQKFSVAKGQHAIDRIRQLCAVTLGYDWKVLAMDYGLSRSRFPMDESGQPFLLFIHGSSWPTKLWPVENWVVLAGMAQQAGLEVLLPWGDEQELQRAREIAVACENCVVLPRMNLEEIAQLLANAQGVVGVDTGLSHMSAALDTAAVTLYLATSPHLTGVRGNHQVCLGGEHRNVLQNSSNSQEVEQISPDRVWNTLQPLLQLECS